MWKNHLGRKNIMISTWKKYGSVVWKKVERFGNLLKVGANFFTLGGELEKVIGGELAMRRVHDNPFPARYLVWHTCRMSLSLKTSHKVHFIGLCAIIAIYFSPIIYCRSCLRCPCCQHLGRRYRGNN